eukprot:414373-Amphidinium_carterae.1
MSTGAKAAVRWALNVLTGHSPDYSDPCQLYGEHCIGNPYPELPGSEFYGYGGDYLTLSEAFPLSIPSPDSTLGAFGEEFPDRVRANIDALFDAGRVCAALSQRNQVMYGLDHGVSTRMEIPDSDINHT